MWNTSTGLPAHLRGHTDYVSSVTFSPDGKTLVSGSVDKTIRLWDVATGKQKKTITGHTDYVSSLTFSPGGHTFASGGGDGTLHLWNVATGKHEKTVHRTYRINLYATVQFKWNYARECGYRRHSSCVGYYHG